MMKALFVGVGSIGTRHIKDFYNTCIEKCIIPEIIVLRRQITSLNESIRYMVNQQVTAVDENDFFDIIFITNPTNLHFSAIQSLRKQGKFFFIEKPIFDHLEYQFDLLELNEKNAYVAAPMRHTQIFKQLYSIVKNENVFSARIICSSYLPGWRPTIDYRKNYSAIKEMGGGVSLDLVHEIDYMIGLFGVPKNTHCFHGKFSNLEISSDDLSVYIIKYDKMLCEVHLDYFGRKYRRTCEIFTATGTYSADFFNEIIERPDGSIINCKGEKNSEFKNEMKYFIEFVLGSNIEMNGPKRALKTLEIALGEQR